MGAVGCGRNLSYANAVHVPQVLPQAKANYVITDKDCDGVNGLSDT